MRRRVVFVLVAALGLGAVILALLPYTVTSKIEVPAAGNEPPDADGNFLDLYRFSTVQGRCQPPVISAWRTDGPDDESLWAVTVGTGVMGYAKATSMGHLCAHSARKRLLGSLGLGVLGVGAVLVGRRMQRTSPPRAEPAPT